MSTQDKIKGLLEDKKLGFLEHFREVCFLRQDKCALINCRQTPCREVTFIEIWQKSQIVADFLLRLGIKKQETITLFMENRPEWTFYFFGTLIAGNIAVPLDDKLKETELSFVINDCRSQVMFASRANLQTALALKATCPNLKYVISIDDSEETPEGVMEFGALLSEERKLDFTGFPEKDETALIVYTSGTTGYKKGVELSFANLLFEVRVFAKVLDTTVYDRFLSLLPLSHAFEITCGLLGPLFNGCSITYLDSLKSKDIISRIIENKITMMIVVPLILNMLHRGIMAKVRSQSRLKFALFAILKFICVHSGRPGAMAGRILFRVIRNQVAPNLRYFVCGSAVLDPKVARDLEVIGLPILEGYGLTETSPVISANSARERCLGSVGHPLEGVEVKIVKNDPRERQGEIATRGPHVMKGYYRDPAKTEQIIKQGWLHTGDIGYLDKKGFLHISGRIKNVIVTGKGKKVFPEEIEVELLRSPYIKDACVYSKRAEKGMKKSSELVNAIIVPDLEYFASSAKKTDMESIQLLIKHEIKQSIRHLADYKRPHDFKIYNKELPKTVTQKLKRQEIEKILEEIDKEKNKQ